MSVAGVVVGRALPRQLQSTEKLSERFPHIGVAQQAHYGGLEVAQRRAHIVSYPLELAGIDSLLQQ